jgi:hypothetical protein
MGFWDFFRKKDKENAAADSSAGFVPVIATSDSDSSDAASHGATDAGNTTITDSGTSSFGGDGGSASGGDGGGGGT